MQRQRGIALITAILLVSIATITAVTLAARQQYDLRRSANLLDGDQAYAYAEGVETWARLILARDAGDNQTDHLREAWAMQLAPVPVPGGQINGRIRDAQGRFNLNNLVTDAGAENPLAVERYRRLLMLLQLPPELADSLLDWLDADIELRLNGAEDNEYLLESPPYRAANRRLVTVSELYYVKGYDAEAVQRLQPFVTALPQATALNVNTVAVPEQAPRPFVLLQMLVEDMSESEARQLVTARGEDGYESVDAFAQEPALAGRAPQLDNLTVSSQYFVVEAEVDIGTARSRLFSLLRRDGEQLTTLQRTRGTQ